MRWNSGSFLRGKMIRMSMLGMAGAGILLGLGTVPLFYLVEIWAGPTWGIAAYLATAALVLIAVRMLDRPSYRWNLENLRKGVDAETHVGQAIEYAITAENCAVAHSVTEISKVGDIDHIVVTPVAIWVIETKYKKVPANSFPEVLRRIAENTDAVRQWAPAGATVRGCLVLAYETNVKRRNYSHGKEKVTVYAQDSLVTLIRQMRGEARERRSLDARITRDIWKLGHVGE